MLTLRRRPRLTSKSPDSGVSNDGSDSGSPPKADTETNALSWETFLDTYLPALVLALGVGIALPAIPTLARSFNVGFGLASGVVTAFLLGGMVGSIPTGWLIDRFGRRRVMLAGPLLTSAMAFLVVTSHSFPELLAYRFFDGWAANMWLMGRLAGISGRARPNQRGRQVSWMYGMDGVGRVSGPLVGGFIATAWGIRAPFIGYGILALLALIPGFMFIRDVAPRPREASAAAPAARMSLRLLILPWIAFFGVAFFSSLSRGPLFADLFHLYAAFTYNLSPRSIGILATMATCVSLPASFLAGVLMDRFGRKRTMVPGFTAVGMSMLMLAVTSLLHMSFAWYVGVFLVLVISSGLVNGSVQIIGADVAPSATRGMFLGVWRFVGQVGVVLSPIVFAFLSSATGYPSAFVFVALASFAVVFLMAFRIPETGKNDRGLDTIATGSSEASASAAS
jgi:MFS family permease